jgi:hypothetical protein
MRFIVWLIYGVALLAGAAYLKFGTADQLPPVKAARALPRGQLIETGDIVLPGGARYLSEAVKAGAAITDKNTVSLPSAAVTKGTLPLVLGLQSPADRRAITDSSKAWICPSLRKDPPHVAVKSLLCGNGDTACLAVIELPADRSAEVAQATAPKLRAKPCG